MWQTQGSTKSGQGQRSSPPPSRQSRRGASLPAGAFLTRGRRRGGDKSKSADTRGLLGDQLLAIRAHLALFVLEQAERLVSGGTTLVHWRKGRGTVETLHSPAEHSWGSGSGSPVGEKEREDLAPAKTLRTCDSRCPKKEAPLSPLPPCRRHMATPHMGYFQGLLTSGPRGGHTNHGCLCSDLFP